VEVGGVAASWAANTGEVETVSFMQNTLAQGPATPSEV
jgi:hypothetical protein